MSKIFLMLVGATYLGLAAWCSLAPKTTSTKVGFELKGGTGQSEFLVVYGGLEFGMALVFFLPLWRSEMTGFALLSCLLIHASLVVFRTVSFFLFTDIQPTTYRLAIGEWLIFLLAAVLFYLEFRNGLTTQ